MHLLVATHKMKTRWVWSFRPHLKAFALPVFQSSEAVRLWRTSTRQAHYRVGAQSQRLVSALYVTEPPLICLLCVFCNDPCVSCAAACSVTSKRRWWRMQRAWGTCSSSTSSSTAAPWTSASSSIPKRNRSARSLLNLPPVFRSMICCCWTYYIYIYLITV